VVTKTAPAPLPAIQAPTGTLFGIVFDGTGAVIPGVSVTIETVQGVTGLGIPVTPIATAVSDEAGNFAFRSIPPGQYSFRAELPGFTPFRRPVQITPGQTTRQNVFMAVGNIVQKVEVMAAGQRKPRFPRTHLKEFVWEAT
jgi:hypothetical protein